MEVSNLIELSREFLNQIFNYDLSDTKSLDAKYKEWSKDFKLSHGELNTQRKINFAKINDMYGVHIVNHNNLFKFIYCLDNLYGLLLTLLAAKSIDNDFSENKLSTYLDFTFFRCNRISNYHPPKDLLFFKKEFFNLNGVEKLVFIIEKWTQETTEFDYVRELFHAIYPREVRHSLGEFYTPDWLAEHTIGKSFECYAHPKKNISFLDPTCGSGTFLLAAEKFQRKKVGMISLDQLYGFDINPISAFAAKTNLLIRFSQQIRNSKHTLIKVFTANILNSSHKRDIDISKDKLFTEIRDIAKGSKPYTDEELHQLWTLEANAAFLVDFADKIIGNPPWVNWEYLPHEYRKKSIRLWQYYDLFNFKGIHSTFVKEDISSLITYVVIDRFLKPNGDISFIVKESLFKSMKQATGFRKFFFKNNIPFGIKLVEDLTSFKPFYGVNNKTVIFYAKKGDKTVYPVQYRVWHPHGKKNIKATYSVEKVLNMFSFENRKGLPLDQKKMDSGWITVSSSVFKKLNQYLGKSEYKARTGVFTGGANGIYWLNITGTKNNNLITVENITERAKNKFEKISKSVERDLLYPYMSGSELSLWGCTYSKYIICPHSRETKMYPFTQEKLSNDYPQTYSYFRYFETELKQRKGFTSFDKKIHEKSFYALQRIGRYTFAPYKVAWKYISSEFTCAVIEDVKDVYLGHTTIIPNEKIIYIGLEERAEAFYLCGLLSSAPMREIINSFKISTQIAPSIINKLKIPKFDPDNVYHVRISVACEEGHLGKCNIKDALEMINNSIDHALVDDDPNCDGDHINSSYSPL